MFNGRDTLVGYIVIITLVVLILALLKGIIWGEERSIKRDPAVPRAYLKSIGLTKTPKGCQVDHVISLKCGGLDIVENVQLICGPSLKAKEKHEQNCEEFFKTWAPMCLNMEKQMPDKDDEIRPQSLEEILKTPSDRPIKKTTGKIPVPVGVGIGIGKAIKDMHRGNVQNGREYQEDDDD